MDTATFDLWFDEAKNDCEIADLLKDSGKYSGAVFHYIQAAEKGIKALLYLLGLQPWGHSIVALLDECEKQGVNIPPEFKNYAKKMEIHYTGTRYPDASPTTPPKDAYDESIAESYQDEVQEMLKFVEQEKDDRVP